MCAGSRLAPSLHQTGSSRRLEFTAAGIRNRADATLELAARSGWALHELPARHTIRTDGEAAEAAAELAARLLARRAVGTCERHPSGQPLTPQDIAIGTAHRDQADQIRQALAQAAPPTVGMIRVDTANRLQGAEFAVTIVLHPLSGRRDATAFHLEAGRLCVLASRHRHACIVVARAGIADLLDAHPSDEPVHLGVQAKFPDGWEANHALSPTSPVIGYKHETAVYACEVTSAASERVECQNRSDGTCDRGQPDDRSDSAPRPEPVFLRLLAAGCDGRGTAGACCRDRDAVPFPVHGELDSLPDASGEGAPCSPVIPARISATNSVRVVRISSTTPHSTPVPADQSRARVGTGRPRGSS